MVTRQLRFPAAVGTVQRCGPTAPDCDCSDGDESAKVTQLTVQRRGDCAATTTSPEAAFANDKGGQVFEVNASTPGQASDELVLWNFCVGLSRLRPEHQPALLTAAGRWRTFLATHPEAVISVLGTASSSGATALNEQLAGERAATVAAFLVAAGLPTGRVRPEGVGTRRPMADATPEGQARNRRVEVFLTRPVQQVAAGNPAVAATVSNLTIGPGPGARNRPSFDTVKNQFAVRAIGAVGASAQGTLVGLPGSSLGMIQGLLRDQRLAEYRMPDGRTTLLDFTRCTSPFLPCRDVGDAADFYTTDHFGTTISLSAAGSASGLLAMRDSPGTAFPLRVPGGGTLTNYFWHMDFEIVIGTLDSGLFEPLHHVSWQVIASQNVDVVARTTGGLEPLRFHGTWQPGASSRMPLDGVSAGATCRYRTRAIDEVCTPTTT